MTIINEKPDSYKDTIQKTILEHQELIHSMSADIEDYQMVINELQNKIKHSKRIILQLEKIIKGK